MSNAGKGHWVIVKETQKSSSPGWSRIARITLVLSVIGFLAIVALAGVFATSWRETFPVKPNTGASGSSGASGGTGASGASGSTGSDIVYTTGFTGPAGRQFPTGDRGAAGVTGPTGITGTTFTINNVGILDSTVIDTIEQSTSIYWYVVTGDLRDDFLSPPGLPVSMTNHLIQWNPFLQQWHDNGPWLGQTGDTGFGSLTGPQGPTGPSPPVSDGATGADGPTGYAVPGTGPVDIGYLFGPGTDGDFGTDGVVYTITLTRDTFFKNLQVPVGATINTNGFRIFVSGQLTLDGTIACNGSAGASAGLTTGAGAHVGYQQRGGAGGGGYDPFATFLGVGGAGATGLSFASQPQRADTVTTLLGQATNFNGVYPTGLAQNLANLYAGGNAAYQLAQGYPTGGSMGGQVNKLDPEAAMIFLSALLTPVKFPRLLAAPLGMNGGSGGGAGISGNAQITAASGGGGGGIVAIIAATIRGLSNPPTGSIQAKGGNAGANASSQDASGGGGGGGVIIVRTTTPYNQWGINSIDVSGGQPNNLNYGPGSPTNSPLAFGKPGQIFILQ